MIKTLKVDVKSLRANLRGQDGVFYLGLFFIVLYYLRPQYIFPQLLIVPWLQVTILSGLLLILVNSRLGFRKQHFTIFTFAILAWLSAKNSLYPYISSQDIYSPFIFAIEVLFLSNTVRNVVQLRLLLIVFFLCIFKMSFFGARTWVSRGFGFTDWGIQGPPGFFQNSGEFTLLMAISAVMSIPVIASYKPTTIIYWIFPLTAIMTVLGASSRGGQLALVVGLIYLLLAFKKINFKYIVCLTVVVAVTWTVFPQEQKDRFISAGEDKTSSSRLAYWEAGIDMALNRPLLGVGYKAFSEHYYINYRDGEDLAIQRKEVAHNSLVQVASTLGIPSLIIYCLFHLFVINRPSWFPKRKSITWNEGDELFLKNCAIALNASVIVYFIGAFFMSVAFYPYIYFLMSISIILDRLKREGIK
ncbi:O-antigen ligase family protein [Marinobacter salarius]|uniref:O-antigen ligase family protein n=1 Tax=Marinobacter salarius TaxID=1420917 RepID=UPI000F8529BA|nr:O-antigen ligase family protein [Marinobacter salarius]AZR42805.1 hypothetical protein MTMN5_03370 [Marinobacter salarius]